ncbi:MAG: hypothetical protein JNM66_06020 [Bryobacterales bacterium]|nr:hypothetical protein [Bryobacterales bacterium]
MLKYLVGILISFIALSFIRAVMGIIQKAVVEEVQSAVGGEPAPATPKGGKAATTADTTLRKCVTCATYKPESSMIRYGTGEKSVFFCSAECEKKANS